MEGNHVESITISEITTRADFNRGTFYTHYQDKIDLLEDLYQDAIEEIRLSLQEPYKDMNRIFINKEEVPSTYLLFEHIQNHKKLFKVLDLIGGNKNI